MGNTPRGFKATGDSTVRRSRMQEKSCKISAKFQSHKKKPDQLRTALASEEGDENFISI